MISILMAKKTEVDAAQSRADSSLPKDGSEAMTKPLPLATFTTGTLPTAADWEGCIIYVSDGSAGEKFRGSDGSAWVNLG